MRDLPPGQGAPGAGGSGGRQLREALAASLVARRFGPDEVLCRRGEVPDAVWFIEDGSVEFVDGAGESFVARTLSGGETFGAAHVVTGRPLPWTARTTNGVRYRVLAATQLRLAIARDPMVLPLLVRELAERLIVDVAHLGGVLTPDLTVRLARVLLLEARDGVVFVPQYRLAAMIGTSRSSLRRALHTLEASAAVGVAYGRILVHDPNELLRRARLEPEGEA